MKIREILEQAQCNPDMMIWAEKDILDRFVEMVGEMKDENTGNGRGCNCGAYGECECGCENADWNNYSLYNQAKQEILDLIAKERGEK